jgi:hypothetical protein
MPRWRGYRPLGIHLRTEEDEHDHFAVMTDPEGNEFCIN